MAENKTPRKKTMISVKCLAHHDELWTFELTYPRFIHSEFMTHRVFSRNACSSRAIPVARLLEELKFDYAYPLEVYMNCKGMSGVEKADSVKTLEFYLLWHEACKNALATAEKMNALGIHKQHINRILEPFQWMRTIVTATEWENFFKLRLAEDCQPEMRLLAEAISDSMENHPKWFGYYPIYYNYWTLPYITPYEVDEYKSKGKDKDSDKALLYASVGRCARVSYNNHDGSNPDIQKDIELAKRLLKSGHMSPFEHVCTRNSYSEPSNYNLTDCFYSFRYYLEHLN